MGIKPRYKGRSGLVGVQDPLLPPRCSLLPAPLPPALTSPNASALKKMGLLTKKVVGAGCNTARISS